MNAKLLSVDRCSMILRSTENPNWPKFAQSRVWLWSMHMNAASLASLLPIRHRRPNFLENDWCCWPLQMNPCWHGGAHPRCRAGWRKETRGRFTLATGAQYFITVHRDGTWNEQTGGVDQRIMGCQRDTRIFRYPSVRRSMFWDEYDKPMRSHDKPNQFLSVWNQGLEFQVQFPFNNPCMFPVKHTAWWGNCNRSRWGKPNSWGRHFVIHSCWLHLVARCHEASTYQ